MRHSKRSLEGEILIDHSASLGLTAEQVGDFDVPVVGKGEVFEGPVLVCSHCQYGIVMNPLRTRERGWCSKCDKYLCDDCTEAMHRTLECRSVERRLDEIQNVIERYGSSPLLLPTL